MDTHSISAGLGARSRSGWSAASPSRGAAAAGIAWAALLLLGATGRPVPQDPTAPPQAPTSQSAAARSLPDLKVASLTVTDGDGTARIILRCEEDGTARFVMRDRGGDGRVTIEVSADGDAAALLGDRKGRGLFGVVPTAANRQPSLAFLDRAGRPRLWLGLGEEELPRMEFLDLDNQDRLTLRLDELFRGVVEVKEAGGSVAGGILGR